MTSPDSLRKHFRPLAIGLPVACAALLMSGCSTAVTYGGGGGVSGGVEIPGGGSSGGGASGGGSSGGGMPGGGSSGGGMSGGGSSGGGMSGGGMSGGGSPGGGMSGGGMSGGGSSGGSTSGGGASGGGGTMGGNAPIGHTGPAGDCNDGGISGGGIGGGMGCDQAGDVGQFPGGDSEQLGKELDKSLGDFDEAIGEEQRQVASVGRNTEGFGDGSSGGSGGTISLGEQEAGGSSSGSGGGGGGGAAGSGNPQANPLGEMSDEEIAARTPDDIVPDAYEDVVARQLREAALAEDDPELRERLWEEYRKYKGLR